MALDTLEFWTGDLARTQHLLTTTFGFEPVDAGLRPGADEEAAALASGGVTMVLRQGTSPASPVARHVHAHGDTVADVALTAADPDAIAERALAHGLRVDRDGKVPRIDVSGHGTIWHSVRADKLIAAGEAARGPSSMQAIDHVTYCLPFGGAPRLAMAYEEVFGLERVEVGDARHVGGEVAGMRSVVLRSSLGFTVVLTEPATPAGAGQTSRFVEAHAGPGVQHAAVAYGDLCAAVASLRSRGVAFLPAPRGYYEHTQARLADRALEWDALQRLDILVDDDDDGLLFQLFTRPVADRGTFFFELIQRDGSSGFGANNVRALFAAVEAAADPAADERAWLDELVGAATERVPFYRDRLAGAGTSSLEALPSFHKGTTAGYGRFPISAGGAPGAYRVLATSGTTGERMCVAFDRSDWDRIGVWLEGVGASAGITTSDVLLNTHCYGLWVGGPALDLLAQRAGAGLVPLGPIEPAAALRFLADGIGTAISATPSYLRRLIETAEAEGFDLTASGLRLGFIGAEPAETALRHKLLERLPAGFRWIECFGLTETGGPCVAFAPDPDVPELVLNTRDFRAEVLEVDADVPASPGAVGELTLTTRTAHCRTPLIRYRTRDLVRVMAGDSAEPTRISRILGRADDALKVGGVLVYPSAVAEIVSGLLPASSEWRAVLRRREPDDELLVEAEADRGLCRSLELAFKNRVGLSVAVSSVQQGALARSREKTQRILVES